METGCCWMRSTWQQLRLWSASVVFLSPRLDPSFSWTGGKCFSKVLSIDLLKGQSIIYHRILNELCTAEQHCPSCMFNSDTEPIERHPDFRLFACMNPATDVGKKDLPPGIRNRYRFKTNCVDYTGHLYKYSCGCIERLAWT